MGNRVECLKQFSLNEGEIDINKVRQGCEFIFRYFDESGFSLLELNYLMASMDLILDDITRKDPLRKIAEFNYSSSVGNVFSCTAASNAKS